MADDVLSEHDLMQMLRAIRHVTPTGEQEYVCADRIMRSHELLRAEARSLRAALDVVALEGDTWASQWALAALDEIRASRA